MYPRYIYPRYIYPWYVPMIHIYPWYTYTHIYPFYYIPIITWHAHWTMHCTLRWISRIISHLFANLLLCWVVVLIMIYARNSSHIYPLCYAVPIMKSSSSVYLACTLQRYDGSVEWSAVSLPLQASLFSSSSFLWWLSLWLSFFWWYNHLS